MPLKKFSQTCLVGTKQTKIPPLRTDRHFSYLLKFAPSRFREEQKKSILREMVNRFGENMPFNIIEVDIIPREKR